MKTACIIAALLGGLAPLSFGYLRHVKRFSSGPKGYDTEDAASPTPTGVPENWFHQKLDHFNPADDRYWNQRYYIQDAYYKPGGAAFLYIGGEDALPEIYARTGAWLEYAKVYSAIGFAVEHRYYGKSHPTADMSTDNLQWLTMEQALEDLAAFITYANEAHNLTDTKWVVFGGSYAGMLSAWMRYKFPHLVAGAVAHSATIGIPVTDTEYFVAVGDDLKTVPGCYKATSDAFDDIRNKLQSDTGLKTLQDMFKMCDFDRNNPLDVENVMFTLLGVFIQMAQYNNDDMYYLVGWPIFRVSDMCGYLTNPQYGKPLERLAAYQKYLNYDYLYLNGSCFPVTMQSVIADGQSVKWQDNADISTGRAWNYQLCAQLGDMTITHGPNQPFGNALSEQYFIKFCQGYYGAKFDKALVTRANEELVMNYAGLNLKATNIVYTQGSFDPFRKIGFNTDNIPGSHVIVIQGMGHVSAMLSPSTTDNNSLKQARAKIQRYIGQWISTGHIGLVG